MPHNRFLRTLFLEIHRLGTTVLIATHDPALVPPPNRHVLTLNRGRIVRDDTGNAATPPPEPESDDGREEEDA